MSKADEYVKLHTDKWYENNASEGLLVACNKCGPISVTKAVKQRKRPCGYGPLCKECVKKDNNKRRGTDKKRTKQKMIIARIQRINRKYGLKAEDYATLYEKQDGKCKICLKPSSMEDLVVDHDHKDGKVRGLLCKNCNIGLGHFKDSYKLLIRAAKYLETKPGNTNEI